MKLRQRCIIRAALRLLYPLPSKFLLSCGRCLQFDGDQSRRYPVSASRCLRPSMLLDTASRIFQLFMVALEHSLFDTLAESCAFFVADFSNL